MTAPSDMPPEPAALSAEERALAQRLARLGPHGEPSPALDARILGAAHDAVLRRPARTPRRRWPVALGVAASLALAVGIAWQLRPLPGTIPAYRSEASAAASVQDSTAAAGAAVEQTQSPPPTPAAPQADAAEDRAVRETTRSVAAPEKPVPMIAPAPAPPPPPEEPAVVFDAPAAMPAPVQQGQLSDKHPQAFEATTSAAATAAQPQAKSAARASAAESANDAVKTDTLDKLQASGARNAAASDVQSSDEPGADVPPATMQSPEVRDAWLGRIRELIAAGKIDVARASLHEFVRRYPDYTLPDDLRALGQ